MTHRLCSALLAAFLALPACTAFRGTPSERVALLSDTPLPMDRTCRVAVDPLALPPARVLVDSAAFTRAAARVWRDAGSGSAMDARFSMPLARIGLAVPVTLNTIFKGTVAIGSRFAEDIFQTGGGAHDPAHGRDRAIPVDPPPRAAGRIKARGAAGAYPAPPGPAGLPCGAAR